MANAGLGSGLGGLGLGGRDGPGVVRRVTRLCPNCGIRRPIHQFTRLRPDGSSEIGVDCSFCRRARAISPVGDGGNGQDIQALLDGLDVDIGDDHDDGLQHADGGQAQLQDESEWLLTGLGVALFFVGWLSIVALFVVILIF